MWPSFIQNDIPADKQPENGGNGEYQYAAEHGAAIKPVFKVLDIFLNDSINLFSILGQEKQPETFAKKPFPRQPKPKHRFSAISLPITPPDFTQIPP